MRASITAILYRTFTYIFSPISYVRGKCFTRVRLAASRAAGAATAPVPWVRRLFLAWGNQCLACHACQECFAKSRSRSRHSTLLLEPRFFQFRSRWIMDSLLEDITLDARLRLEKKIRDSNRTLTAISSERRKTIDVDGVHRQLFPDLPPNSILRDLSSLSRFLSAKSLLRLHRSGDFCLVAPLQRCTDSLSFSKLSSMLSSSGVSQPAWLKNDFSAVSDQLLLPFARHGDSCFWQVACLSPGTDVSQFCSMPLVTSLPLVDIIITGKTQKHKQASNIRMDRLIDGQHKNTRKSSV